MKRCSACRLSKQPEDFYRNKAMRDGLSNLCRECFRAVNSASRKKNWERVKAETARYTVKHREQINASQRIWRAKRYAMFPDQFREKALADYYNRHPNSPCVYVIRAETGQVKIGHTINLPVRVTMLQCGSPVRLEVAHVIQHATKALAGNEERRLRGRFKPCRIHGEWFQPNEAMQEWLKEIACENSSVLSSS